MGGPGLLLVFVTSKHKATQSQVREQPGRGMDTSSCVRHLTPYPCLSPGPLCTVLGMRTALQWRRLLQLRAKREVLTVKCWGGRDGEGHHGGRARKCFTRELQGVLHSEDSLRVHPSLRRTVRAREWKGTQRTEATRHKTMRRGCK